MLLVSTLLVILLSLSSTSSSAALSYSLAPQQSWYIKARNAIIEAVWGIQHPSPYVGGSEQCGEPRFTPKYDLASYGDDIVLRFRLQSPEDATALTEAAHILFLDTWQFTPAWADIRLSKEAVPALLGLLPPTMHHAHAPLMHDLAQVVRDSSPPSISTRHCHLFDRPSRVSSPRQQPSVKETNIFFGEYQPLSVIENWMRLLQSLFTTHVRLIRIGTSYEGRDIQALRVGVRASSDNPSKTVVVSGGSHAREWISTSTVNYIAYTFITEYGRSKDVTDLLERFDFVFIPSLNPDGYVYTFEHDRLWRKNRQNTSLPFCTGLDLERAYGFEWSGDVNKDNPCSESFAGGAPFEAHEARQFADWARNETDNNDNKFVAFLDLHSYSQQVLYPYAFSCTSAPPSLENLEELAIGLAKAIRTTNGEAYGVASACEGSVPDPVDKGSIASADDQAQAKELRSQKGSGGGSALDWFYHELKVPYTYQLKLRDTGSYGFLLPSENIVPTGKEAFKAVEYLGKFIAHRKDIREST